MAASVTRLDQQEKPQRHRDKRRTRHTPSCAPRSSSPRSCSGWSKFPNLLVQWDQYLAGRCWYGCCRCRLGPGDVPWSAWSRSSPRCSLLRAPEGGCSGGRGVAWRHHRQPAADTGLLRRRPARRRASAGGSGPATASHPLRPPARPVAAASGLSHEPQEHRLRHDRRRQPRRRPGRHGHGPARSRDRSGRPGRNLGRRRQRRLPRGPRDDRRAAGIAGRPLVGDAPAGPVPRRAASGGCSATLGTAPSMFSGDPLRLLLAGTAGLPRVRGRPAAACTSRPPTSSPVPA